MNYELKNFVEFVSGYTFRDQIVEDNVIGDVYLLRAKDIDNYYGVNILDASKIVFNIKETKAFVNPGDVLISTRGEYKTGVVKSSHKAIATSTICILRIKETKLLPEYLALVLRSDFCLNQLLKKQTSTTLPAILVKDLRELIVPIVSIEKQKKIISLMGNIEEQKKLLSRKKELLQKTESKILNQIIEE